jgi:hypothetical protein
MNVNYNTLIIMQSYCDKSEQLVEKVVWYLMNSTFEKNNPTNDELYVSLMFMGFMI